MVAQGLIALWSTHRELMWRLAESVASQETNRSVILGLTNGLLSAARTADPEQVQRLALIVDRRFTDDPREEESRPRVRASTGSLLALLWVERGSEAAHARLEDWLAQPSERRIELGAAVGVVRESLILGYAEGSSPTDEAIRCRGQELVTKVVEVSARSLANFLAADRESQAARADEGRSIARLLDHAFNQLYFASGASRASQQQEGRGLNSGVEKLRFLVDIESTLRRIGDVGTPRTIHYLLELLRFLLVSDPARVFDLTSHALLEGGRRHGYQHEPLGVTSFVALVGTYLADYRELFADDVRRERLIDCIDAFIQAGWPEARRLLYRLPELLQ